MIDRRLRHIAGWIRYNYDALGNRLSRSSTVGNILAKLYTYDMNLCLAQTRHSEIDTRYFYYGYDGHGNVRFLTDEDGQITDTYDYDPPSPEGYGATGAFGNVITRYGTTPNNYLYCGEQFDPDLGLYFLRARYMDTDRGRFWTMDVWEGVFGEPASLHKYGYVGGDPVSYLDPSGLRTVVEVSHTSAQVGHLARITVPRALSARGRVLARIACAVAEFADKGPVHHIFTNKNWKKGMALSERFDEIFKGAGLSLDDWYNKVRIPGHKGPHEAYNRAVYAKRVAAVTGLDPNTVEYANAVVGIIVEIIDDICEKKSPLYKRLVP